MKKIIILLLLTILVSNCNANRSQVGAVLGGATTTSSCVAMGVKKGEKIEKAKLKESVEFPMWNKIK